MVSLVDQRKQRIDRMIEMIREKQPIEPQKLIKLYAFEIGCRERLARNYLELLIDIEKVEETIDTSNPHVAKRVIQLKEKKGKSQ